MSNSDNKGKKDSSANQGNSNQPQQPLRDPKTYIERGQNIKK
jgi:hypothetical protein